MPQTSYASDELLAGQPSVNAQLQPSSGDQICTCHLCKKSINAKGVVIKCCSCLINYHLACVVNKFGSAYDIHLRNSIQWLSDFLKNGDFQFVFVCIRLHVNINQQILGFSLLLIHIKKRRAFNRLATTMP